MSFYKYNMFINLSKFKVFSSFTSDSNIENETSCRVVGIKTLWNVRSAERYSKLCKFCFTKRLQKGCFGRLCIIFVFV